MSLEYTIYAFSPTLNQEIREFNIEGGRNNAHLSSIEANQWAHAFAHRLNEQQYLTATDWQARLKQEELGIHTITGYIG